MTLNKEVSIARAIEQSPTFKDFQFSRLKRELPFVRKAIASEPSRN